MTRRTVGLVFLALVFAAAATACRDDREEDATPAASSVVQGEVVEEHRPAC